MVRLPRHSLFNPYLIPPHPTPPHTTPHHPTPHHTTSPHTTPHHPTPERVGWIRELFEELDADGGGALDTDELKTVLKVSGWVLFQARYSDTPSKLHVVHNCA